MITLTFKDWAQASLVAEMLRAQSNRLDAGGAVTTAEEIADIVKRIEKSMAESCK